MILAGKGGRLCLALPNLGRLAENLPRSLNLKKCSTHTMYMGRMGHSLNKQNVSINHADAGAAAAFKA